KSDCIGGASGVAIQRAQPKKDRAIVRVSLQSLFELGDGCRRVSKKNGRGKYTSKYACPSKSPLEKYVAALRVLYSLSQGTELGTIWAGDFVQQSLEMQSAMQRVFFNGVGRGKLGEVVLAFDFLEIGRASCREKGECRCGSGE